MISASVLTKKRSMSSKFACKSCHLLIRPVKDERCTWCWIPIKKQSLILDHPKNCPKKPCRLESPEKWCFCEVLRKEEERIQVEKDRRRRTMFRERREMARREEVPDRMSAKCLASQQKQPNSNVACCYKHVPEMMDKFGSVVMSYEIFQQHLKQQQQQK